MTSTATTTSRIERLLPLLMIGILTIAGLRIWVYFAPAYRAGVDEATYFLTAKALATTGSPAVHSPDPLRFVPNYMVEVEPGVFYQKYPIGYPLLLAGGYLLNGPMGAFLVNPVMGVLCILGAMLLARDLLGAWPAAVTGACMAFCPAVILQSVSALSHMSDACFAVFGLWLLWRWMPGGHWGYALGTGLLLGFAVSIRNTEALLVLVVGWAMWRRAREVGWRRVMVQVLPMAAGAIVAVTPLLLFQWKAFGSPLRSGYSFSAESTAFSLKYFVERLPLALRMLNVDAFGLPVFVPLAVLGLVVWGVRAAMRVPAAIERSGAVGFLALWIVPTFLLYCAYYWTSPHATIYLRLFFSIVPAVIIAAAATVDAFCRGRAALRAVCAAGLVGVSFWMMSAGEKTQRNLSGLAWIAKVSVDAASGALPRDSVLVTDETAAFFAAFATDYEIVSPLTFDLREVTLRDRNAGGAGPYDLNALRSHRYLPLVAGKSQTELDELLRQFLIDRLEKGQRVGLLAPSMQGSPGQPSPREYWTARVAPTLALRELHRGKSGWVVYEISKTR